MYPLCKMGFWYIACANIQFIIAYAKQFCIVSLCFLRVKGKSRWWFFCVKRENGILLSRICLMNSKKNPHQFMHPLCKTGFCYIACANIQVIIAYAKTILYCFFVFPEGEGKEEMMILLCGEKNDFKKSWKLISNEIAYRINNQMWVFWKIIR